MKCDRLTAGMMCHLLLQLVTLREADRKVDPEDRQTALLHLRSPPHIPLSNAVKATGFSVNCTWITGRDCARQHKALWCAITKSMGDPSLRQGLTNCPTSPAQKQLAHHKPTHTQGSNTATTPPFPFHEEEDKSCTVFDLNELWSLCLSVVLLYQQMGHTQITPSVS